MNDQTLCNIPAPAPTRGFQREVYLAMEPEWGQYRTARQIVPLVIVNSAVPILGNDPEAVTADRFLKKVRTTLLSGKAAGYFVDQVDDDQRSFRIANKNEYAERQGIIAQARLDRAMKVHLRKQRPAWMKFLDWALGK